MKKFVTLSLAALLLSSTAVMAQSQASFDSLDSDGNDQLSYTDLLSQWPDLTQDQFDAADVDGDDVLDLTQFEALQTQRGSASVEVAQGSMNPSAMEVPMFENVDSNGDGHIAFGDLKTALPDLTQDQFDSADMDNDDFLDATQYEALKGLMTADTTVAAQSGGMSSPSTLPMFEDVDTNGDGHVAFGDIKIAIPGLTQEQFDSADMDNDDVLDRAQYEALEM